MATQGSAQDNESAGYLYTLHICKHENYRRHFESSNYYSGRCHKIYSRRDNLLGNINFI
jgi:hypothetical protein